MYNCYACKGMYMTEKEGSTQSQDCKSDCDSVWDWHNDECDMKDAKELKELKEDFIAPPSR